MNSSHKPQPPLDVMIGRLAARQHGVVHIRQLFALGMSQNEVAYRVRIGRLWRIHRGVYAVGRPNLDERGRFMAAVLAVGDGAVLSHASAAIHWGFLPTARGPVHVTVARARAQRTGIRLHCPKSLDPRDTTSRRNIPITTPARTLLDLAATEPYRRVRRAVNEALVQRKVTLPMLQRQARGANGHRGVGVIVDLIAAASPTRSELEDMTLDFLRRHAFGRVESNVRVAGVEVDFLIAEHALVIEADGGRFHDNPLQRAADERKRAALEAAGLRLARVTWEDVTRREPRTARRLAAICAQRPKLAA